MIERDRCLFLLRKVKAISYVPSIELHFGCTALFPPMNVVWLFYVDLILDVVEKLFLLDLEEINHLIAINSF